MKSMENEKKNQIGIHPFDEWVFNILGGEQGQKQIEESTIANWNSLVKRLRKRKKDQKNGGLEKRARRIELDPEKILVYLGEPDFDSYEQSLKISNLGGVNSISHYWVSINSGSKKEIVLGLKLRGDLDILLYNNIKSVCIKGPINSRTIR